MRDVTTATDGRRLASNASDSYIFVNGPSRSGKGCNFVFTNALEWRGSLIAIDIKNDKSWRRWARRAWRWASVFSFSVLARVSRTGEIRLIAWANSRGGNLL